MSVFRPNATISWSSMMSKVAFSDCSIFLVLCVNRVKSFDAKVTKKRQRAECPCRKNNAGVEKLRIAVGGIELQREGIAAVLCCEGCSNAFCSFGHRLETDAAAIAFHDSTMRDDVQLQHTALVVII